MIDIRSVEDLEALVGQPQEMILMKQLSTLEDGCLKLLANSPLAGFGYMDETGNGHSIMVGGFPGFSQVLSPTQIKFDFNEKISIPAKKAGVSMVFLLPGIGETLRLNGKVETVTSKNIIIAIEEIYIHCARSILRSKLWQEPKATFNISESDIGKTFSEPFKNQSIVSFIKMSPFAVVSTWHKNGSSDTSPRGDETELLNIISDHALVMPDRKGNQRTDTFHNLISNNQIALSVLMPGSNLTLQIQGTGSISTDADLLASMALSRKPPLAALIIEVKSAIILKNEAILKSDIWNGNLHVGRNSVPDMMALAAHHMSLSKSIGLTAKVGRFVGKVLGGSPRFMRFLINLGYKSQLKGEGYITKKTEKSKATLLPSQSLSIENTSSSTLPIRKVKVVKVVKETADAVTLFLEDVSGKLFDFKPGQFFTVLISINGEQVMRSYSASNAPGEKLLTITVKMVYDGLCSTYINQNLKSGDTLELRGPSGLFCVKPDASAKKEYVLLAGGSGITPMMSITQTVLAREPDSKITLLYGNRTWKDVIFANKWIELTKQYPERLKVRFMLSSPSADWEGGVGILDEETSRKEIAELNPSAETHFYICGPAPMMKSIKNALISLNVSSERIHEEKFSSPSQRATNMSGSGLPQSMTILQGGKKIGEVIVPTAKTLLQAGLDVSLPMPFSCGMGNCGECQVKLISGDVQMAEPNCLSEEEKRNGYILTCVSRPIKGITIEISPLDSH